MNGAAAVPPSTMSRPVSAITQTIGMRYHFFLRRRNEPTSRRRPGLCCGRLFFTKGSLASELVAVVRGICLVLDRHPCSRDAFDLKQIFARPFQELADWYENKEEGKREGDSAHKIAEGRCR